MVKRGPYTMKEIINIIKEIKKIEEANEELVENKIVNRMETNETIRDYENSKEGELLQKLDETKDIYTRGKLIKEIKELRNNNLNRLYEQLDSKVNSMEKECKQKQEILDANIKELYTMKSNRGMLLDEKNKIRPECQKAYDEITQDIQTKIKENGVLNREIKEKEQYIKEIKSRNFDILLEDFSKKQEVQQSSEEKQKMVEEISKNIEKIQSPAQGNKNAEKDEEEVQPQEIAKPKLEQNSASTTANANNGIADNPKLIITPNKAEYKSLSNKYEVDLYNKSVEEQQVLNSLSKETLKKLADMSDNNITTDWTVIKGLLKSEKQLNDYLDLCQLYNYRNENFQAVSEYTMPQDFPEFEYDFTTLRKNEQLSANDKMEKYKMAKETRKMFAYMNLANKLNIKMSFLDKAYFEIKDIMNKSKEFMDNLRNRKSLPAPDEQLHTGSVQETNSEKKSWELSDTEKKLIEQFKGEMSKSQHQEQQQGKSR